jgi:hypothetical protein
MNHKNGYNSSVVVWNTNAFTPIYTELEKNFVNINKLIVRFDFWLEMVVANALFLDEIYPNQIVDYSLHC